MRPFVVIDADVLGRQRTGDETYVHNLLRALPGAAPDLRLAAISRYPELVPDGVEAVQLKARSQEWRMAISLPRLLRKLQPDLIHLQYALPPRCRWNAVVTVHDLSFERHTSLMPFPDRLIFRTVVPRAVERARLVLTVSDRTQGDLEEVYGVPAERIVVTPNGVDPEFRAVVEHPRTDPYLLFVGAIQARKNPLAAMRAADCVGLPLVIVGPAKDRALAEALRVRGAILRGWIEKRELAQLYRGAAALLFPSSFEGFGLPILEAMASGTPVVATPEPALQEIGGDAIRYAEPTDFGNAVREVLADRARWVSVGLDRARRFSWTETARLTADAYRRALREACTR